MKQSPNKLNIGRGMRILKLVFSGGIIKVEFFEKHFRLLVYIVMLIFFATSNRYYCIFRLKEIDTLQKRIKELQYESVILTNKRESTAKRSQIKQEVDKQGLLLDFANTPPYILKK